MCVVSKSVLGTCKSSTIKYSRIKTASKWNLRKKYFICEEYLIYVVNLLYLSYVLSRESNQILAEYFT